nr:MULTISPECIES: LuxR family transcriptional regulator [unclassified Streptomyces]
MAHGVAGFGFVGRGRELRALLDVVRTGPAVVFVEGEAGIGKSRLVTEAVAALAGGEVLVLQGWCHPLREPLPIEPVIEALRDRSPHLSHDAQLSPAVRALVPYLPELADRLPPDGAADLGEVQGGLMRAAHEVLAAMGSLVLVIEDVHWADEATCELLRLLATNPPQGLRLVITYRGQDLPAGRSVLGAPYRRPVGVGGRDIRLGPLDEAQVRDLTISALGRTAGSTLGRQVFERSGGLPLAVEEDLLALSDRLSRPGRGEVSAVFEGVGVPRAVREAVNLRLSGLEAGALAVVHAAAVLAVPAPQELLAALAGLEEKDAEVGLTAALKAAVLQESSAGQYGFRHTLARQAVYEGILGPRRQRLHLRASDVLIAREPPPLVQIAHHTRQHGDVQAWLPRAQAAAEQAIKLGDDGIATDLLQQLLAEPALPPGQRSHVALALGRIADHRIEQAASVSALRRILADPVLPIATRGEIRLLLARTLLSQTNVPEFNRETERAIGELDSRPDLAAVAMAQLGMGNSSSPVAQDVMWMDKAVHTITRSSDPGAQATVLASRITLLETLGDPSARELLAMLPRLSQDREVQRQRFRAVHNAADEAFWRGDDERARALLDEAERLASQTRTQSRLHSCRVIRLNLEFVSGAWDGLEGRLERIAPVDGRDEGVFHVEPFLIRALLEIARGSWVRARERLTALAGLTNQAFPPWEMVRSAATGRLDLAEGRGENAWETMQPALELLRHKGVWGWAVDLVPTAVQVALAGGLEEEADRLIREATHGIEGRDAPGAAAELWWCQGLVAARTDPPAALKCLERARARFQALGRVHRAARITEGVGTTMLTAHLGHAGRAAGYFQEATDVYRRLGATADEARCSRALREIGQERPVPRGRHSYGEELSPRERQVAQLLATGATNQDIAGALSLSVRTVEHHVAKALKKLHVTRSDVGTAL